MSRRVPLVLSALALVVALLGSTPLGEAARKAGIVAFARKAAVAEDSALLNGHRSSRTPKAGMIPVVGRNGKLPASLGAIGLQGPQGPAGPTGPAGPAGPAGAQGPAGAVAGYTKVGIAPSALSNLVSGDLLASLSLPAGKYVIFGRVVIVADGNVANFIGDCVLSAGTDQDEVTVGGDGTVTYPSQVNSLMITHDFAAAGTAELRCHDSSGQPARQASSVVTAIPVTSIVKP